MTKCQMGLSPNGYGEVHKIFTRVCADVHLALLLRRLRTEEATPTVQMESLAHSPPLRKSLTTDSPGLSRHRPLRGADETTGMGAARLKGLLGSTCTWPPLAGNSPLGDCDCLQAGVRDRFAAVSAAAGASALPPSSGGGVATRALSSTLGRGAPQGLHPHWRAQTMHSGSSSKSAHRLPIGPRAPPAAPQLHCSTLAPLPHPVSITASDSKGSMASMK